MAKKRKQSATQSVTLHDFFSKTAAGRTSDSSQNKKPKLRLAEPSSAKHKKTPFKVAQEDIIVIDDDDDDCATQDTPVPSSSHSGLEVKRPAATSPSTLAPSGPTALNTPSSPSLFGEPTLLLDAPLSKDLRATSSNAEAFGEATLLHLDAAVSSATHPVGLSPPLVSGSGSGTPEVPVEHNDLTHTTPDVVRGSRGAHQSDLAAQGSGHLSVDDSDMYGQPMEDVTDFPPADDEWGMGDDEINTLDADIQDDFDLPEASAACPICGQLLHAMVELEIQRHVNKCLDACSDGGPSAESSTTSLITPKTKSPPLTPIQATSALPNLSAVKVDKENAGGAYSVLMSSYKENEAWKEASAVEDRNFRPTKANGGRRKAPFYKVLQGMPIAVDAFRYGTIPGVTAYFLTHAHSDHYTNLSANWKSGPIYCSQGTANLIMHMLGVDPKWVHPLPWDVATEIPNAGGVHVTCIEANHCPGSCLFLFEGKQTVNAGDSAYKSAYVGSSKTFRYLHCGDFRASPRHALHPAIKGRKIDHVYLDTTYLDPKYCFPPQAQVISACAELARRIVKGETLHGDGGDAKKNGRVDGWLTTKEKAKAEDTPGVSRGGGRTLVVVGTYSIGKERIVKAIAKALKTKVYSDTRKTAILRCQADTELDELLTSNPLEAGVHLLPLGTIASDRLKVYMERWKGSFSKVVGFRPTGWTYSPPSGTDTLPTIPTVIARSQSRSFTHTNLTPMKNSTSTLLLYGVPYSEHSSFFELTCFALSVDWGRMIATVNVGRESSRGKMAKWVEKWEAERKRRGGVEVVKFRETDYW